jgi:alpha-tubulin suppressor-like RCC1 family protein
VHGLASGAVAIAAGWYHTCALTSAGAVLCWGLNGNGQLGDGTTNDSPVPVPVSGLSSGVAAIAGGGLHTCALTTAGAVQCWGENVNGQLGNNTTVDSHVPVPVSGLSSGVSAIGSGFGHTCAISSGGLSCWGWNGVGQLGDSSTTDSPVPVAVSGLSSGVAAVAGGYAHTCVRTTAGGAECWGSNGYGRLGNNSLTDSHVPVAVSEP